MERKAVPFRLSAMMFGQYFIMGAWIVTLPTFLLASPTRGGLGFPPSYTGWIYSTLALAGIVSPLATGFLADRLFAAQKLLAIFHLFGGVVLGGVALWCAHRQIVVDQAYHQGDITGAVDGTFPVLFGLMLLHSFFNLSTLTLSNVVAMRNLRNPERSFGRVRLFGTIGWIAAGLCVEVFLQAVSAAPLFLASVTALGFGVYCLTLPRTPPKAEKGRLRDSLGLPALKLLEHGPFLVLIACSLAVAVTQQFYVVYTNPYLNDLGAPYPTAIQTLAQVAEVGTMLLFPVVLPRWGFKTVLALGLVALVVRNALFASESVTAVVAVGLPLHGLSYAFFSIVAALYVDGLAPPNLRASAQGMVTFITLGAGTLFGNWLAGVLVERHTLGTSVVWGQVWFIPTVMTAVITVAFVGLFRGQDHPRRVSA